MDLTTEELIELISKDGKPKEKKKFKRKNKDVVENITYPNFPEDDGTFEFWVNNYNNNGSVGFKAEVEFMGVQYQYDYPRGLSHKEDLINKALNNFKR